MKSFNWVVKLSQEFSPTPVLVLTCFFPVISICRLLYMIWCSGGCYTESLHLNSAAFVISLTSPTEEAANRPDHVIWSQQHVALISSGLNPTVLSATPPHILLLNVLTSSRGEKKRYTYWNWVKKWADLNKQRQKIQKMWRQTGQYHTTVLDG